MCLSVCLCVRACVRACVIYPPKILQAGHEREEGCVDGVCFALLLAAGRVAGAVHPLGASQVH